MSVKETVTRGRGKKVSGQVQSSNNDHGGYKANIKKKTGIFKGWRDKPY